MVDFRTLDLILRTAGFRQFRQRGSHVFFRHPDGRATSVPNHPGRDIPRPLLRNILSQAEISLEEFERLRHDRS